MKLPIFALLVAVSIVPGEALLTTASSRAETPVVEPCEGLQGNDARDRLDAYELLTSEPPDVPKADFSVAAARSAEGWRYRFLGSGEDAVEQSCPDDGPLTLPISVTVELLLTGDDTMYEWSVPALGLDVALIPGRVESVTTIVDEPGDFDGSIVDISGARIESADGSLRAIEQSGFDSWTAAVLARRC